MSEAPRVLRVKELHLLAARALEMSLGRVHVAGEIAGFHPHASGHVYFSLKEPGAEIRCVLFRSKRARLRIEPRDGLSVIATGRLDIYAPRGSYQLVVDVMRPEGEGSLHAAYEALRAKLQAEGLFDPARKRQLPRIPRVVGVVTSASGAAITDILRVLSVRWPAAEVLLAPVRVQGEGAAASIARAILSHERHGRADVLVVGRGGGSAEDLRAFNQENVVRAIVASPIPVISAVGHESDVTLSDLVADVRAATPSQAAELSVPDRAEIGARTAILAARLSRAGTESIRARRERLAAVARSHGLGKPRGAIEQALLRLDDLSHRLTLAAERHRERRRDGLDRLSTRLVATAGALVSGRRARVEVLAGSIEALSPFEVLGRGYALVSGPDGTLVRDGGALARGDRLSIRFGTGRAEADVREAYGGDDARGAAPGRTK